MIQKTSTYPVARKSQRAQHHCTIPKFSPTRIKNVSEELQSKQPKASLKRCCYQTTGELSVVCGSESETEDQDDLYNHL